MAIHKTTAQWAEYDLVMKNGETGVETDTGRVKIGDGARLWSDLPYFASGVGFLRDIMAHRHFAEDFIDLPAWVRATDLAGLSVADASSVTSGDTLLSALGKLQARTARSLSRLDGLPEGYLSGGRLQVSVSSGNLTLSLKTLAGADPSAADPVLVRIADAERAVTAPLSVFVAAGINWCNAGGTELATQEIDYFAYLGYNATDGVTIGFSRIPYGRSYSDFAVGASDARHLVTSSAHAVSGDVYRNIGRFAAKLSAGSSYAWSLPADTRLVHHPILSTRWLAFVPAISAQSPMTVGSFGYDIARYRISGDTLDVDVRVSMTTSGAGAGIVYLTNPMPAVSTLEDGQMQVIRILDGSNVTGYSIDTGVPGLYGVLKQNAAAFGLGASRYVFAKGSLMLA